MDCLKRKHAPVPQCTKCLCAPEIPSGVAFEVIHACIQRFLEHPDSELFLRHRQSLSRKFEGLAWSGSNTIPALHWLRRRFQRGSFDGKRVRESKRGLVPAPSWVRSRLESSLYSKHVATPAIGQVVGHIVW